MKLQKLSTSLFLLFLTISLINSTSVFSEEFRNELDQSNFGKIIIGLEQLASQSDKGLYDDLFQALDTLVSDLETRRDAENLQHKQLEGLHIDKVDKIQEQIDNAAQDIKDANNELNILNPKKLQLQTNIQNYQNSITQNQNTITTKTNNRNQERSENQQKIQDLGDATQAIVDALVELNKLLNSSPTTLIQLEQKQRLQSHSTQLESALNKVAHELQYGGLVKVLTQIADDNFADQATLQKVIALLQQLQQKFNDELADLQNYEKVAEFQFNKAIQLLQADIQQTQTLLNLAKQQLIDTNAEINKQEGIVQNRSADKKQYETNLQTENDLWNNTVQAHNDLVAQYEKEILLSKKCITYLRDKLVLS